MIFDRLLCLFGFRRQVYRERRHITGFESKATDKKALIAAARQWRLAADRERIAKAMAKVSE